MKTKAERILEETKSTEKVLSMKISPSIHQQLKVLSATSGMSIKDIVLDSLKKQYDISDEKEE